MNIIKTEFKGLYVFEPRVFKDARGYFFESYNANVWSEHGIDHKFIQDNESKSQYGTVRGLHYQIAPYGQVKLVRCAKGKVLDIVVDLRKEEPTYGKSFGIVLSSKKKNQLLIPRGFAHGFSTLSKSAIFSYKCDNFYSQENEFNIHPLDAALNLDWKIDPKDVILSEKDKNGPAFGEHKAFD